MAKQQVQKPAVLGRVKKYQDEPKPWQSNNAANESEDLLNDVESMPAPLYKASFFSSIDDSLKLIESSES